MFFYVIGQVLTVLGYIIYYISRYCKEKTKIVIVEALSKFIIILSFVCLKKPSGVLANSITMTRSIVIYAKEKNQKKYTATFLILLISCILCGIMTYQNIFSCFAYIAAVITTSAAWYGNPQQIRLWGIIASVFYLFFQISCSNIMGAVFETGTMLSAFLSYIKYLRPAGKEKSIS